MSLLTELEELIEIEIREQASPVERALIEGQNRILRQVHELRKEVRKLATQDEVLTADVEALTGAFTDFETAIANEIATIKSTPAADDPIVAQALTNIESLTAKIKADTAAALPAPASTDTGDGSTAAATGDQTAS